MSDLILNINIPESKKRGRLLIDTYDGTIPHLKNRQYSGPLRNININGVTEADNLSSVELEQIKSFLNASSNVQINKYQYIIAEKALIELTQLPAMGCLFYRDKGTPMFQVDNVFINSKANLEFIAIGNSRLSYQKTSIYLQIENINENDCAIQINPKAYVDININNHPLELVFEYDGYSVSYKEKNRSIGDGIIRDYGYEERIVSIVKECGWNHTKEAGFLYIGKDFQADVLQLVSEGVDVFVDKDKKVAKGDFSSIEVSYGIDWFDIKGDVQIDEETVNVSELIDFKTRKENWVELNGNVIIIPKSLSSVLKSTAKYGDSLRLEKTEFAIATEIALETSGKSVIGVEKLIDCDDIVLDINPDLKTNLREYQKTGVKWLLSLVKNGFGGCLADDMGLGKTLQIIACLADSSMSGAKSLIVVPKTLLINWEKEFQKFSPSASVLIYHGAGRGTLSINECDVVITTYGTVLNDIDKLSKIVFNNLIIDEAQYIKNPKTKIYRAIKRVNARTRIILTGTPVENNIQEFWGLMKLVNPSLFAKMNPFHKNYDSKLLIERIKRLTDPFILRRMKAEVLDDLPERQEQTLYCKMDSKQQELYDNMLFSIQNEIKRKSDRFEIKTNSIMLNGLLYLQEICCHPLLLDKGLNYNGCKESAKYDQLLDVVDSLYTSGHKVVIFSRFTKMLRIIEKQLIRKHYNCFYLDGQTKDRMDLVDEFESSKTGIFLISLKAGGTGLNLVSADTAIIYDPWWNPAVEKQAEDRIYRIGQKKNVMVYKMIVEGSIEEKVQQLQKEKMDLYNELLDNLEAPKRLTADIMKDLLMS